MSGDPLRSVRSYYYLGQYQRAIKEAKQLAQSNPAAQVWLARAQAMVAPSEVFALVPANAPTALLAVKQLATYRSASADQKELALAQLQEWLSSDLIAASQDSTLVCVACSMYFEQGDYKEALKLLKEPGQDMEMLAWTVQVYLKIHRLDLAAASAKRMADIDEDHTLAMLAGAWTNMAKGGDKVGEAVFALQELMEKFEPSVTLLNSLGVCYMLQREFPRAVQYLKQARDLAVSNNETISAETLTNTVVCFAQLNKPDLVQRVMAELQQVHPRHGWLQQRQEAEALFDKHAANYAVATPSPAIQA